MKKSKDEKKLLEKLTTYLSQRTHSEYELKCKLIKTFSEQEVEKAIFLAKEKKWLSDPEDIALQLSEELHRKKKGWLFIQAALKKKGLPTVEKKEEREEEKCRWWLEKKFSNLQNSSEVNLQKVYRFLSYRGFEESLIKKVVYKYTHGNRE